MRWSREKKVDRTCLLSHKLQRICGDRLTGCLSNAFRNRGLALATATHTVRTVSEMICHVRFVLNHLASDVSTTTSKLQRICGDRPPGRFPHSFKKQCQIVALRVPLKPKCGVYRSSRTCNGSHKARKKPREACEHPLASSKLQRICGDQPPGRFPHSPKKQ